MSYMVEPQSFFGSTPRERFLRRWAGVSVASVGVALLFFRFPPLTNVIILGMLYGLGIPASYLFERRFSAPTVARLVGRHAAIGSVVGGVIFAAIAIALQAVLFDGFHQIVGFFIVIFSAVIGTFCGIIAASAAVKLPRGSVVAVAVVGTAVAVAAALRGWRGWGVL